MCERSLHNRGDSEGYPPPFLSQENEVTVTSLLFCKKLCPGGWRLRYHVTYHMTGHMTDHMIVQEAD